MFEITVNSSQPALEIVKILAKHKIPKYQFDEIYRLICQEYEVTALFPEIKLMNLAPKVWIGAKCEEVPEAITKALEEFFAKISITNGEI